MYLYVFLPYYEDVHKSETHLRVQVKKSVILTFKNIHKACMFYVFISKSRLNIHLIKSLLTSSLRDVPKVKWFEGDIYSKYIMQCQFSKIIPIAKKIPENNLCNLIYNKYSPIYCIFTHFSWYISVSVGKFQSQLAYHGLIEGRERGVN